MANHTGTRLLLITTGGTIAGLVSSDEVAEHQVPGDSLMERLESALDELKRHAVGIRDVTITPLDLFKVDSSDVQPDHWKQIVDAIAERFDKYDAFIVAHGTNTLGYTTSAVSFALVQCPKLVVFTGAQVPFNWRGSDAQTNLENAIYVAALNEGPRPERGVVCVFGSHVITGTRVKKSTEFDYDAFQSFSTSSLGRIGREIRWNQANLNKHHSYLKEDAGLIIENNFDDRLLSFTEFPGMSPDLLHNLVEKYADEDRLRGIIFRAYGAGDVSTHLHPAFEYIKERQIPVAVTTQAPNGVSNFRVNEPGKLMAEGKLGIPVFDMNIESMTAKLMWLLAQQLSYYEVSELMITDLHGEISREDLRPS